MALKSVFLETSNGGLQAATPLIQEPVQWWQTFTLHAVGVGQQDMPIWIPWACNIVKWRYRIASAGSGGSLTAELRKNGIAGGNTISGTSATPSTSPSFSTGSIALAADDLLWLYVTAINTTPGAQMKAELLVERALT